MNLNEVRSIFEKILDQKEKKTNIKYYQYKGATFFYPEPFAEQEASGVCICGREVFKNMHERVRGCICEECGKSELYRNLTSNYYWGLNAAIELYANDKKSEICFFDLSRDGDAVQIRKNILSVASENRVLNFNIVVVRQLNLNVKTREWQYFEKGKKSSKIENLCKVKPGQDMYDITGECLNEEVFGDYFINTGMKEYFSNESYWKYKMTLPYLVKFITYHEKHPEIETLLKNGFFELAAQYIENGDPLKASGMKLNKVVKLPKPLLREYANVISISVYVKEMLEDIHRVGEIDEKIMNVFTSIQNERWPRITLEHAIKKFRALVTEFKYPPKELAKFLKRANEAQAISYIDILELLLDYVSLANKCRFNYKRYPNSLKKEHDIMIRNFNFVEKEVENREFVEKCASYSGLQILGEDYAIVIPKQPRELIEEGIALSHCVGGYISRVAKGDSMILFLRKTSNLEQSWYTLELIQNSKGEKYINQLKGFSNCPLNEQEAKDFVKFWAKKHHIKF